MSTALSSEKARRQALGDVGAGLILALAAAAATWSVLDLTATYLLVVAGLYAGTAGLILATLPAQLPSPGLGTANRVTLVRTIATLTLAGLLLQADAPETPARWWVVFVGTGILLLDGLDGWIARRTDTSSAFGARLDMETDAFLMLVLSALVWIEVGAGAWVLMIGAMRYFFVAAGWLLPQLQGELFPSFRRKTVCVVQGIALLVALGPIIPRTVAIAVCAVALALLVGSFAIDTVWLLRTGRGSITQTEVAKGRFTP